MSRIFFEELGLPEPDCNLEVGSGSHAWQTAQVMLRFEQEILARKPDRVLVYGDVNSTLAASLVCSKLGVPVGHVEAGLRSGDRTMPEEINRLVTDRLADLLFTPSADGDAHLLAEGVSPEKIHLVGNVMADTLVRLLPAACAPEHLEALGRTLGLPLTPGGYVLVTLHRPGNVDQPAMLADILRALHTVAQRLPVVFPVHPRTRSRIAALADQPTGQSSPLPSDDSSGLGSSPGPVQGLNRISDPAPNQPMESRILLAEPLGYLDFLALQKNAAAVITDSGGHSRRDHLPGRALPDRAREHRAPGHRRNGHQHPGRARHGPACARGGGHTGRPGQDRARAPPVGRPGRAPYRPGAGPVGGQRVKALFFLSHPAHFHLFRVTMERLFAAGDQVQVVAVKKDVLETLLAAWGRPYHNIAPEGRRLPGLSILANAARTTLVTEWRLVRMLWNNRPDVLVGTELTLAHVGRLLGVPSLLFNEDDTAATPENKLFYPFAHALALPACCDNGLWPKKRVSYHGCHELAYLHPAHFTPDPAVAAQAAGGEPYILLRLAELTASHDVGKTGITNDLARRLVALLGSFGRVLVTAERALAPEFEPLRVPVHPSRMHHVMAHARLYVGDSQTMAAEAAVLGVPSLRCNDFVGRLGYLEELEHRFSLTQGIKTQHSERLLTQAQALLTDPNTPALYRQRRETLLRQWTDPVPLFEALVRAAAARQTPADMRRALARLGCC